MCFCWRDLSKECKGDYKDCTDCVLDKIKAEIEQIEINGHIRDVECFRAGVNVALNVIDKYKAEMEKS
jgi:hypothetical protein